MLGAPTLILPKLKIRPTVLALCVLALLPVVFVAMYVVASSRNIVYWDEFDTVLDLLLKLDGGMSRGEFFHRIFAVNNEHRMVTSRLIFAASWWATGTVDFRIIGGIGNLFLVTLCGTLVASAGTTERRVRLGLILAALMFQLEHFENLLWSGASIDHFQVVALAVGAIALLARGTAGALGGACFLGTLGTFTLAHGLVIWPAGAFLLWRERRWRSLAVWAGIALGAMLAFLHGFEINSGHRLATLDPAGIAHMASYWLSLIGAPLAMNYLSLAPWLGAGLLAATAWLAIRGAWRHEPVMTATLLFCLGALALIALGRSEVAGGRLESRYMVLSTLAWATVIFAGLEAVTHPVWPFRRLAVCLPLLVAFNVAANVSFAPKAESFVEGRDGAVLRYKQFGRDGRDPFRLYPLGERARQLLTDSAQRGVYRLPRMCTRAEVEDPHPSNRIQYYVDEMTASTNAIYISGWAAIPEETSRRGQIHLVFRSEHNFIVYTTVAQSRPDVATANSNPDWRLSGFRFAIGRWRLPPEDLQIGIMIVDGDDAEFVMTDHRLRPAGRGEALLANSQ
jgi:hypothetical protein